MLRKRDSEIAPPGLDVRESPALQHRLKTQPDSFNFG
jgi:hypothetical protein